MTELIPISVYSSLYYYILLFIVLLTAFQLSVKGVYSRGSYLYAKFLGNALLVFLLIYIGLRPIHIIFGDMIGYAERFRYYESGGALVEIRDVFFQIFTKFLSSTVSLNFYFFICALLYVLPLYFASKRLFQQHWFYAFLFLIVSFSFWAYGTNGIRNGISTSLLILAITYRDKKWVQYSLFLVSYLFHNAMILPIAAFFLTKFYRNHKLYFFFWTISIFLSLLFGDIWKDLVVNLGINDDRSVSYLTTEVDKEKFSRVGFRWDFLLYSAIGTGIGYYFIVRKKFRDPYFIQIVNMYLFCNAIWILLIRANFSNRFAYLSWFMLGLLIIYPFLKQKFFKNQGVVIAQLLILYYFITFVLEVVI